MDFSTSEITPKKVHGNNVDFSSIEITSKKLRRNNADFSTIEIISKKVRRNNEDFSISKVTPKKVCGNNVHFLTSEITSQNVRRNDVDFLMGKIISKKYVEMTWKFVRFGVWRIDDIDNRYYRRRIDIHSKWCAHFEGSIINKRSSTHFLVPKFSLTALFDLWTIFYASATCGKICHM